MRGCYVPELGLRVRNRHTVRPIRFENRFRSLEKRRAGGLSQQARGPTPSPHAGLGASAGVVGAACVAVDALSA